MLSPHAPTSAPAAATEAGLFEAEIVPVEIPQRKGAPIVVTKDEGIRPDTTVESLGGLRAAFAEGGSITAGNSSQISDGASAVVLTTRSHADENGWPVLAVVGASGQVAGPDNSLHSQPARAIEKALAKQGVAASDPRHRRDQRGFRRGRGPVAGRARTVGRRREHPRRRHRDRSPDRRSGNGSSCTPCTSWCGAEAEPRRSPVRGRRRATRSFDR
jgi:hypothetical protein